MPQRKRRAVVKKEHVKFIFYGLYQPVGKKGGKGTSLLHGIAQVFKKNALGSVIETVPACPLSTLGRCSFPTLNGDYWTVGRKTRGRFDIKKSQHGIIQDHLIHNSI